MNLQLVQQIAKEGETETVEFKATTGERRRGAETLCALLNSRGGRVLYGVNDKHEVRGQQCSEHTIEEIMQEVSLIEPRAYPQIDRVQVDGTDKEVIVLTVTQGQVRPYAYKGRSFRRTGTVNSEMSREEYNRMLLDRFHGEQRWENAHADGWEVADLDTTEIIRTVEEAIRRNRTEDPGTRDPSAILLGLGLIKDGRLLRAAPVLFGQAAKLDAQLPQCLLRLARFRGTDRTEFLDNRQVRGNVFELIQRADRFLRETLPVAGRISPSVFERLDDPFYPPAALREAIANAVCHRDYSIGGGSVALAVYDDRLEITSSGSLHFGLTPAALFEPHESLPWNPVIAKVLYRRGVIESWGRGTIKIAELMEQAGLPRPEIEDSGGCVTVRFRPGAYTPPTRVARETTDRQRRILAVIGAARAGLALREIKASLRLGEWQIKEDLALLKSLGLVETFGHGRGAYWRLVRGQH